MAILDALGAGRIPACEQRERHRGAGGGHAAGGGCGVAGVICVSGSKAQVDFFAQSSSGTGQRRERQACIVLVQQPI